MRFAFVLVIAVWLLLEGRMSFVTLYIFTVNM